MRDNYRTYTVTSPPGLPADIFYFTTDSGVKYEVRFGRKANPLYAILAFGVLNDEFNGEEYSMTNKGEVFRVMTTVMEVVRQYQEEHPFIISYEFSGIPDRKHEGNAVTTRTRLYHRYLRKFLSQDWNIDCTGNKIIVTNRRLFQNY